MREKKKSPKRFYMLFAICFIVILFGLSAFALLSPDKDYSDSEKRKLAQFPEFSVSSLADGSFMDGIESWIADQFPFREQLMQAKASLKIYTGAIASQGIYRCEDGTLMEAFTMPKEVTLQEQAAAITNFSARYEDTDFYFCLVPNAISVQSDKLPRTILSDDQNVYIDYMAKAFQKVGTFIDVRDTLEAHKDTTQLYYHTDHHWTTDGAYLAYRKVSEAMELNSSVTYTPGVVCNTFSGSLVSASGFPAVQYDNISIYMPEEEPVYTVTYENTQTMTASVYSMEHLKGNDPYEVFFGGNHPKITIRTGAETDRTLLVIKDSYANCFLPFLLPDFSRITIVDPRYYSDDLDMEVLSAGYTDVLFLYNVNTLSQDTTLVPVLNYRTPEITEEPADEPAPEKTTYTIDDIAFIGDSRTLSMATGGRLAYALIPDSSVFATWGGKLTDEAAFTDALRAAEAGKKVAVFWFGINDAQGNPSTRSNDTLFRDNYKKVLDFYRKYNPDSEIVILSVLTTSIHEQDYYDQQDANIAAYNKKLQKLCEQEGYTYISLEGIFHGEEDFVPEDHIHFTKSWYEESFIPFIYEKLKIKK